MTITHPGRLAALFLSGVLAASPAFAQDDEEIAPSSTTLELQKLVAVLQSNPNATSQDCVDALTELHKTQDMLEAEQKRTNDPDVGVARDVLETDFETAVQSCRPDATAICDKGGNDPKLARACMALSQSGAGPN
ncbi:hypothetical protein [Gluconacetobacter takamatsuzukensis]|uniref:Secreted protein n=1 Tax=Gluconacetobacter takamatsuzukensis TaxID=1286190 RepID=A0A7W4KF36_9PROT|nr:hypothetical protein [Gluconacetobacter takamatsuzukensis]MBB2205782.1 hypothetical protein [Gluconacetobacter takamatsuzukensis]